MLSKNAQKRYNKVESFLMKDNFNGFTKDDLFIMKFIKKGWGQDIAALSHMAESLVNISIKYSNKNSIYTTMLNEVVKRAIHPKVNPYKKQIEDVISLGKFGYYLEHLNIILGSYLRIDNNDFYKFLNRKISFHLIENSMSYSNYHADLLPYVKMKWPADQSAILYSLWLYDKNHNEDISSDLINKWFDYMNSKGTHKKTGLYKTEVLGTRKYSNQPRGCSCAYMIHYMSRFSPHDAYMQWELFKKHMMKKIFGRVAFREFLPEYKGKWSPDSGPIIAGCGVAATGLGLNASSSVGDSETFKRLEKSMNPFISLFNRTENFVGNNFITKIGTDLLASSIWLNAETKENWFN